jgi:hypothetical protein
MFLMNTIKRVIKKLPKVDKETDEGWDVFEDDTNPNSRNYNASSDPLNPACPRNPLYMSHMFGDD